MNCNVEKPLKSWVIDKENELAVSAAGNMFHLN